MNYSKRNFVRLLRKIDYNICVYNCNQQPLNDWKLALFVLLLVGLDACILSILHIVEFYQDLHIPNLVPSRENLEDISGVSNSIISKCEVIYI